MGNILTPEATRPRTGGSFGRLFLQGAVPLPERRFATDCGAGCLPCSGANCTRHQWGGHGCRAVRLSRCTKGLTEILPALCGVRIRIVLSWLFVPKT